MNRDKLKIVTEFEVFESQKDLKPEWLELFTKASEAKAKAYAPYSHFNVGAAVLLDNGKIVIGNNQENAAYPSGLCAERVALFQAAAVYNGVAITAICVVANSKDQNQPVTPCGACRQAMSEYEILFNQPIRLIMGSSNGKIIIANDIASLLPLGFGRKYL